MQPARLGAWGVCVCRAAPLGMLVVIACGVFAGAPACRAQAGLQTPQQTNERIKAMSLAALREQREYVIGGGDVLSVEVFDVDELSRDVRVSQAGTIALPLLPVRLHVAGLTEIQIEQKIAEVLEANGLVTHPQVSVTVKEKRSKPITVIGAVNHPMVYQADHAVTLLNHRRSRSPSLWTGFSNRAIPRTTWRSRRATSSWFRAPARYMPSARS